jgi:S-adenosylmethionine:tRNA ribosyltransferase-isomerase
MKKSDFNYQLPEALIAQKPLQERSASRMLVLGRESGSLEDRQFVELLDFLSSDDLVVFNNTKVIPARLFGQKSSGGKVEILIERIESEHQALAHIKASKAPKPGSYLILENGVQCEMLAREQDLFRLRFEYDKG